MALLEIAVQEKLQSHEVDRRNGGGPSEYPCLCDVGGREVEDIVSTFTCILVFDGDHPGENENGRQKVLGKFDAYFVPKCNVSHGRAVFRSMTQQANESGKICEVPVVTT